MQVFTYYTRIHIGGKLGALKMLKNHSDQSAVIRLWKQSWRRHGWQPVVLGEADALRADAELVRQMSAARPLYRSPNPQQYERACYLRWIAMTARGGLMTDYDVLNLRFTPDNWIELQTKYSEDLPISLAGGVPCCVGGTRAAFKDLTNLFLEFAADPLQTTPTLKASVSDQNILDASPNRYQSPSPLPCAQYSHADWQSAPLVHIPHFCIKTDRARAFARIIAEASAAPTA